MFTNRRAGVRLCRSFAFAAAFGVALVSGARAMAGVRITVSTDGTTTTTTDLAEQLADLVAGRDLWSPWARWIVAAALVVALLLIGAVAHRARRTRRPVPVTAPANPGRADQAPVPTGWRSGERTMHLAA